MQACTTIPKVALTIPEFCQAYQISRATFYKMIDAGDGPRLLKIGKSVRITVEAIDEWRQRCEGRAA